ncbi:MAG: hypothetical protein EBR82_08065 [Caulobacteraceae bacterium]|nr:hypothetical protein [Caulobacteraceae bacterium]
MERWSVQDICERGDKAFERFRNWHTLNQVIAEIFYPERADFTRTISTGEEIYWEIFDGEPILMRRDLANQLGAMLRRRGARWFEAKAYPRELNRIDAVAKWCEASTDVQREVIYAPFTRFTEAFQESDNDYVAFGASVLSHTYNQQRTGLFFRCLHLRDCAWYVNGDGVADEMHETMRLTLSQMKRMGFVLPKDEEKRFEKDPHREGQIRRCVVPADQFAHGKGIPRDAKYAVAYVWPEYKHLMVPADQPQPWFKTWPYLVRRFTSVTHEPFGRSPCTGVALADSRMLNQAQMAIIEGMEKAVNKPLIAPNDSVADGINIRAGGVSYYDAQSAIGAREPIYALDVSQPERGMEFVAERRQFLGRAFFQNLIKLPPIDGAAMTAFEVNERIEQYVREAAPIFEPMEAENAQIMEGIFERIRDADGPGNPWGAFPEPPEELLGAEIRFEFDTPLTATYRKQKTEQAVAVLNYVGAQAAFDPGIVDNIDFDAMGRDALKGLGLPSWLKDEKTVAAVREQKAEQQQMTEAANLALQAAQMGMTGKSKGAPQLPAPDPVMAAMTGGT